MALWDIRQSKKTYPGTSLAFNSDVVAGNLIVCIISGGGGSSTGFSYPTIGGTGSYPPSGWTLANEYNEHGNGGFQACGMSAWIYKNHGGGAVTIYANSQGRNDIGMYIYEVDTQSNPTGVGLLGSAINAEDYAPWGSGSPTSYSAKTLVPLHSGLLFSFLAQEATVQSSFTQPTGWTLGEYAVNHVFASAYVKCTGGSSYTQDWAWSTGSSIWIFASFGLWIGADEPAEPTAYYKMEEASGNRVSERGSYDLTPTNTPGNAAGKIGNALALVGASSQEVHSSNAVFRYTTGARRWGRAAWLRFSSVTTGQIVWARDDVSSYRIAWLFLSNGTSKRLEFTNNYDGAQTTVANSFGDLANDTWYFVTWGNDGYNDFLSVNGVFDRTAHKTDGVSNDATNEILGDRGASSLPMTGRIDGYYYLRGVMTQATHDALYNGGSGDESWLANATPAYLSPVLFFNRRLRHPNLRR